jgi:hypothetical protein
MGMSEGVEGSAAAGSGRPRWLVLDIILVLVLTFGLHRLLTRTLSGPMLWWSYSPALLMLVSATCWSVEGGYRRGCLLAC